MLWEILKYQNFLTNPSNLNNETKQPLTPNNPQQSTATSTANSTNNVNTSTTASITATITTASPTTISAISKPVSTVGTDVETNLPERRPSWRLKVEGGSKVGATNKDHHVLISSALVKTDELDDSIHEAQGWCAWFLSLFAWDQCNK